MRGVLGVLFAAVFLAAATPATAEVTWLCHPDRGSNPCVGDLKTTNAGNGRVSERRVDAAPKVDCFYVYPTVSNEPGPNATKLAGPEIRAIAQYQAQQFSSVCRVFAPVYRQLTAPARALNLPGSPQMAFGDVREAFLDYLTTQNKGRGIVLIGHSQGATMLRALIRAEVDKRVKIRRRLVSAILPGANVLVARGRDVGGDFETIPACRGKGQSRCVAAWSTFDYAPPDDALFGRPRATATTDGLGLPAAGDYEVLCTNPAVLSGNKRDRLEPLAPSQLVFPGVIGLLLLQTYGGIPPMADTPWIQPADRYRAHCSDEAGANVLRIDPVGDAQRLRPAPDDTWGQHLVDLNLSLGNVLTAVRAQIRGYRAVRLSVRRRGTSSFVTIRTSPRSRVRLTQRLGSRVTERREVKVFGGVTTVKLPAERLRHYSYRAKRLN